MEEPVAQVGSARAQRALDALQRFVAGDEDPQAFLAEHEDLRDLLQPAVLPPGGTPQSPTTQQFGRFRCVRLLGRGGMGTVFLAEDPQLRRLVALKVLAAHLQLHPGAQARFLAEARIMSNLVHPNVVRVLEVGESEGIPYLVMELVDGVSLAKVLPRLTGRLASLTGQDVADAVGQMLDGAHGAETGARATTTAGWAPDYVRLVADWGAQIAEALQCAHAAGIVHRDVKPSNILVRRDGRVVLTDFGLARHVDQPGLTRTGDFAGTPHYAAPEQHARAAEVDHRADLFALGATLYELCTHQRPFDGDSAFEIRKRVEANDPRPASALNPRVPRDLAAVLEHALEKDRGRRYQTAAAFADDLRCWLEGRPVAARPISAPGHALRWARRNRLATAFMGTLVLGTLAVGALAMQALRSRDQVRGLLEQDLGDSVRGQLESLRNRSRGLVPVGPAMIAPLTTFIAEADALAARLPELERHLAALRALGVVATTDDEQAAADRRSMSLAQEIELIEEHQDDLRRTSEPKRSAEPNAREDARLAARHAYLSSLIRAHRRYRFAEAADRARHDRLEDTVLALRRFAIDADGELAEVRARLDAARALAEQAHAHDDLWRDAARDLRADPRFAGVDLEAQLDLIPIGRDPTTGLLEFAHVGSGDPAVRTADGTIAIGPTTAMVLVLLPPGQVVNELGQSFDLAPFFCSKFEMSVGQMRQLTAHMDVGSDGHARWWQVPTDNARLPAVLLPWRVASEVLARVDLALPTAAQWEYACRAGTTTKWHLGDNEEDLWRGHVNFVKTEDEVGHMWYVDEPTTPNDFGLWHMHGNVCEWLGDTPGPEILDPSTGHRGATARGRLLAGGFYSFPPRGITSGHFLAVPAEYRTATTGIRASRPLRR